MEIYQKEYIKGIESEYDKMNYSGWIHGQYMVSAIQTALSPKKCKYPNKPYCSKQEEENQIPQELKAEIQARKFEEWASIYNKKFQN